MAAAIQFLVGMTLGCIAMWCALFLCFVYPYSGFSLKWLWCGIPLGAILGVAIALWLLRGLGSVD